MKAKGGKCLALVAVLAMVVCAFAIALPAGEVVADDVPEVKTITNSDELADAIEKQQNNQVWNLAAGEYKVFADMTLTNDVYSGAAQGGWCFPITADNITIRGAGPETVLKSTNNAANGAWASQNFITVFGDNVTIKDVTILGKQTANKAIEVLGDNCTIENCILGSEGKTAGSILYTGAPTISTIKNTVINGETIKAWRADDVKLHIDTVTINLDDFYYTLGTFGKDSTVKDLIINVNGGTFEPWYNNEGPVGEWVFSPYTLPENSTVNITGEVTSYSDITIPDTSKVVLADSAKLTFENGTVTSNSQSAEFEIGLNGDLVIGKGSAVEFKNGAAYSGTITGPQDNIFKAEEIASAAEGSFKVTGGSLLIGGTIVEADGTYKGVNVTVSGSNISISGKLNLGVEMVIEKDTTVTISDDFEVADGATLTSDGTINKVDGKTFTNNGTVNLNLENNNADIVDTNNGKIGSSVSNTDALGLNQILDTDLTITNKAFLEKSLVIEEGFTLTVDNNATLELNGCTLYVYGTLVVKNNGAVYGTGKIFLSKTGAIDNSGIIGKNLPVTVGLDTDLNSETVEYGTGSVAIANASGMKFDLVKTVGDKVNYDLAVSGNVSKKGTSGAAEVVISGTVLVKGDLSIGNGVTLKTTSTGTNVLKLLKSSSLDVTSKGAVGTKDAKVSVFMDASSVFNVNGYANVEVSALTGSVKTTEIGSVTVGETKVTITNVKGITLEAKSQAAYDSTAKADVTEYRLLVSGSMGIFDKKQTTPSTYDYGEPKFKVSKSIVGDVNANTAGKNMVASYYGIFVDGTLAVSKDMITSTSYYGITAGAQVTVNGTIVFEEEYDLSSGGSNYIGAGYDLVSSNADGVKITNTYITSFDAAFAKIADAKDKTIYAFGPVKISSEIALDADQYILGDAEVEITEDGKMTVGNDATFNCASVDVQGILVKMSDGTIVGAITYSAMTKDDEGNITYSGFLVALKNAKEGDVIEISQETKVTSSFTIPAGVTVKIIGDGDLQIGTLAKSADLTVDGTLINKNRLTVTGKTTVNGVMDITEAASSAFPIGTDKPITVTGKIVAASAYTEYNLNAVQYIDDDNQYVYTTLAKAVEAVSKMDVGRTVNQVGNVSDSTAVTLEGITLNVNGTAAFGNIELVNSSVIVNGTLTATIVGKTGEDGSTAASEVALAKVQKMSVACGSAPNSKNVTVWSVNVTPIVIGDTSCKGAVTFAKGEANLKVVILGSDLKVLVSDGAAVTIPYSNMVTVSGLNENASALIVNGVLNVKGTLNVNELVEVAGTMNVTGTVNVNKALAVTGTLAVSEKEDAKGTVTVGKVPGTSTPGFIAVGAQPETLGAAGAVTGPIALNEGYVKVYNGATVEASKIALNGTESDAKKTVFNINGFDYMTAYAKSDVMISAVLGAEEFNLVGYITNVDSEDVDINDFTTWFSDADMTKALAGTPAVGSLETVYYKAQPAKVAVKVSVGTGISMYIDGIKVTSGIDLTLAVGKHNVSAIVDPGFKGTVKTFFNGAEVTGSFTITPEMASAAYTGTLSVSASGDITADSTVIVDGGDKGEDGMSLTDILLIVLVVLIAVIAIIVALRMMRS